MDKRVAVIDYGMGNLYSVSNALKALGASSDIVVSPRGLDAYDKLILPGVGSFGDAMHELKKRGFVEPLKKFISSGKPFLGICLGMQLLFSKSEESRGVSGLGVIPGEVKKFSSRLKCPHMGWNEIKKSAVRDPIFKGVKGGLYAYFCHSYYVKPEDDSAAIGKTEYGIVFASMVRSGRLYGVQFHPEKSQEKGLVLLKNFLILC